MLNIIIKRFSEISKTQVRPFIDKCNLIFSPSGTSTFLESPAALTLSAETQNVCK